MKRISHCAAIAALLMASFLLPSCIKEREYIEQHSSDIGKYCRIDSAAALVDGPYLNTMSIQHYAFSYDAKGRPLELRLENPFQGIGPDLHFRYDKKGRLSDVLQTDPGQTFVYIWSRYTYVSPHLIIDSFYEYQDQLSDPNPTPASFYGASTLQVDNQGRIGNYDHRGNLIVAGRSYDDKINIYQTSPTWQLLYLDYSRNNITAGGSPGLPVTPAAYNAFGLPTEFLGPFLSYFDFGSTYHKLDISYSCDVPSSPPYN